MSSNRNKQFGKGGAGGNNAEVFLESDDWQALLQ